MSHPAASQFRQAIEEAGLRPPDSILADGKLHRFASSGDRDDDAGWYTLYIDGVPAGVFGCWRKNVKQTWSGKGNSTLTLAERERQRTRFDEARRQREHDERLRHVEAAHRAQAIWIQAAPALEDHPYLRLKGIQPHGVRVDEENRLIVPVMIGGSIASLQTIGENGEKLFLPGGAVKGGSYTIGDLTDATTILICEGYATGSGLYEATDYPVVMAFTAGNLQLVAQQLCQQYLTAVIVVAGDNDFHADGKPNTGLIAATAAAEASKGLLAMPEVLDNKQTDWNDVHVRLGLDVVRQAIEAVVNEGATTMRTASIIDGARPDISFLASRPGGLPDMSLNPKRASDFLAEVPEPTEWVLEDFLALGSLGLIAGKPKEGKTTLIYELCVKVARGETFLGRTTRKGGVLILAVEEHQRDVKMRLHNLGAEGLDNLYINVGALTPTPTFFAELLAFIQSHDIRLVVVDTLAAFWSVQNENDASEMTKAVKPLLQLARASDACILLIHHARKSEGSHGDEIRGSGALFGLVDIAIIMKRHSVETQRLLQTQSRYPETPAELVLELRDTGYVALGDPAAVGKADKMRRLQAAVTENPEEVEALAKKAGLTRRDATRLLALLLQDGAVARHGKGKRNDPHRFSHIISGNPPIPRDASKQETSDSSLATPNASVPPARNESGLPCETDDNLYAEVEEVDLDA